MSVAGHHDAVGSMRFDSASQYLAIGGVWGGDGPVQVFAASVSVWKLTDTACTLVDATHSRQAPADETGRAKEKFKRIFKGLGRKGDSSDKILYQVAFSPNAEYIAGLSIDGSAYIWKARTLALARPLSAKNLAPLWQHSETPTSRVVVGISWWNNNSLIVVSQGGELMIISVTTSRNLIGKSAEVFDENPLITRTVNGLLFILESQVINTPSSDSMDNLLEHNNSKIYGIWQKVVGYLDSSDERWHSHRPRTDLPRTTTHHRLIKFQSTTPELLFRRKVMLKEYADALGIAEMYGLDSDLVYQKQWAANPVSSDTLLLLSKIRNISWVLWECHVRIPRTPEGVRLLLEYGLRKTMSGAESIERESFSPQKEAQFLHRIVMLQYLDRLNTYVAIYGDTFDSESYAKFRDCDLVAAAIEYAYEENFKALEVLFTYHGVVVLPYRLDILSCIPETRPPSDYSFLLPVPDVEWSEKRWREEDWVERASMLEKLGLDRERLGKDIATVCEDMLQRRGNIYEDVRGDETRMGRGEDDAYSIDVRPLDSGEDNLQKIVTPPKYHYGSKEDLENWYTSRAREIDTKSGLVTHSQLLVTQAINSGLTSLAPFAQRIEELYTLVYFDEMDVGIEEYEQFDELHRLTMLLQSSTDDTFVDNLKRRGVYLLADKEKFADNDQVVEMPIYKGDKGLFHQYLVNLAKNGDLYRCLQVFRESRPVPTLQSRIIEDSKNLLNTALACVYACPRTDLLGVMNEIFSCLPERDEKTDSEDPEYNALQNKADKFEEHLWVNEVLQKYNLVLPMQQVAQITNDKEAVTNLLLKACHNAKRASLSEDEWKTLHYDMSEIRKKICPSLQRVEDATVAAAVLEVGKFKLAGGFLKLVSQEKAEELVLGSAREYFNSAPTYDHPNMAMARSCLALVKSPNAAKELHLIEAITSLAKDYSYPLLPIQVRLGLEKGNKYDIVAEMLANHPSAYQKSSSIVKLCHSLAEWPASQSIYTGVSDSVVAHLLIARAAHKQRDFDVVYKTCIILMGLPTPPAHYTHVCDLFIEVGSLDDYHHDDERLLLLGYALSHCSEDSLMQVLPIWQNLEIRTKCKGVGVDLGPRSAKIEDVTQETECVAKLNSLKQELLHSTAASDAPLIPSVHPFYHTLAHVKTKNEAEYSAQSTPSQESTSGSMYISQMCLRLLNLYPLESLDKNSLLLEMAKDSLRNDWSATLPYLLALPDPSLASPLFEEILSQNEAEVKEQILSLASYYYALIVYSLAHKDKNMFDVPARAIIHYCSEKTNLENAPATPAIELFKKYRAAYDDAVQDRHLKSVNVSVDITRIRNDEKYKREVITALARSPHPAVLETALGMAVSYDVAIWDVIMDHVDAMLTVGPHTSSTLQSHLTTLLEKPDQLEERLQETYSQILGTDFSRLIAFFNVLKQCHQACKPEKPTKIEEVHLELLEAISDAQSLQSLDYKELVKKSGNPLDVLEPELSVENLPICLEMAQKMEVIRQEPVPEFSTSKVHLALMNKLIHAHVPESDVKRYEECTPYIDKLDSQDVIAFFDPIIFNDTEAKFSAGVRGRACSDALSQLHRLKLDATLKSWASKIDDIKPHIQLQINLKTLHNVPVDVKQLLDAYSSVEEIFIRTIALGHSPVLLANLISASQTTKKKKQQAPSTSLFTSPKILDTYLSVLSGISQALNSVSEDSAEDISDLSWPPSSAQAGLAFAKRILLRLAEHVEDFTSIFNTVYNKLHLLSENPSLPLHIRIELLELLVASYKQVSFEKNLESLDVEDYEPLLRKYKAQDIVTSLWLGTITEDDMNNTSLDAVTSLFSKLLANSPDYPHLQQLTNLLTIWTKNHPPSADSPATPLHACWLSLYKKLIETSEASLLFSSWEAKPFAYLDLSEESEITSALDQSSHLDIQFAVRSPYDEHLISAADSLISRFGNSVSIPDWEPLNLATPPPATSPSIPSTLPLPESYLYSLIRLAQLPKLASANLLSHFTNRFLAYQNGTDRTISGNPKESIEFALAQLCAAHMHFHACAFLISTSWCMDAHARTMDNVLLFLDRFLDRRGKLAEKREGWEGVGKFCGSALNILRKDWQSGA
eukprot:Phypoly_transcript_00117.p1 GENE.Phypoly_transcript_00117~~Phypoly_transcript_00117.p1  ORF type:complete len:2222 (+),score=372.13 Phypoly_transcript_00117:402-6668(+)